MQLTAGYFASGMLAMYPFFVAGEKATSVWSVILDNTFGIAILFIFASAILAVFFKARSADKCLKDMRGFQVTLEQADGGRIWGKLNVYSSGIELEYPEPHRDGEGHLEISYIVYSNQFKDIHVIYRYHDELIDRSKRRREMDIKRTYRPSFFRRTRRRCSNFVNTLRDAIFRSFDMLMGQMKKGAPGATVVTQHGGEISAMGKQAVGHFGNAFDPILERHIGKKVVLETTRDGQSVEYPGILKEYSPDFLEVLDIQLRTRTSIRPGGEKKGWQSKPGINVSLEGDDQKMVLTNKGKIPVRATRLEAEGFLRELDLTVSAGSSKELDLDAGAPEDFTVTLETVRQVDMIVPRLHWLVRHGAEE
ncbi:MAG: hypothetical protein E3J72_09540 [Planctomycetota bacterium]|nr:MAG: hypothetical protein E3J72_09540 [Planctomycetota bacterium]